VISIATWVVWLHLLAIAAWLGGGAVLLLAILPTVGAGGGVEGAARRANFFTSRGMEIVIITGGMNLILRGMGSDWVFSRGFIAMLTVKILLVVVMVGLQVWMGLVWKREGGQPGAVVRRIRAALTLQLLLGAAVVLLGLGVHSV
jgi:hypothetical protein